MDDELALRFEALTRDLHQQVRLGPSARVRAAGDRRRVRALAGVAGVAAGVTALVGGGAVAVLSSTPGLPPATQPPLVELPAGFALPHEKEAGWHVDASAYTPMDYSRCHGWSDPTSIGRSDARTAISPDRSIIEQVFLFENEAASRTAMTTMMRECQVSLYSEDGQGFVSAFGSYGTDGATATAHHIGVAGNLIFVASMRGPEGSDVDNRGRTLMVELADGVCAQLSLCAEADWTVPTASPSASGAYPR